MKKGSKSSNKKTEKGRGHEYQNIHDFNPSQFTTEEELEKIKEKKEKVKNKEDKK